MSDLLSSSSLLLAILTTLYGIFYSAINEILKIEPKPHAVDNKSNCNKGIDVRKSKIIPLLIASIGLTLIFVPEAYKIMIESCSLLGRKGLCQVTYDTVKTTYIAVTIFFITLTFSICRLTIKFNKHLKKLNP